MTSKRKAQASKRERAMIAAMNGNVDMRDAFIDFRKGSRTSPHKNLTKYDRNAYRREAQRGY